MQEIEAQAATVALATLPWTHCSSLRQRNCDKARLAPHKTRMNAMGSMNL